MKLGIIRICGDPSCDAIYHNCPNKAIKCDDCGGSTKVINQKTFWLKFSNWFFQYDYNTGEYFRPQKELQQLELEF